MILINFVAALLIVYLAYYLIYFSYIIHCASKGKIKEVEHRSHIAEYENTHSIVVYCHNNESTVLSLVDSLKQQEYNKKKYKIHVILDNCTDDSSKKLEIIGGIKIWRISTEDGHLGKNKAFHWLLDRLITISNDFSYILLNADCIVKKDFLAKVNTEISEHPVVTGRIISTTCGNQLICGIKKYLYLIQNKLIKRGKNWANFANIINTDICAIRKEVLEQVMFATDSNQKAEILYSMELNKNGVNLHYSLKMFAYKQIPETVNSYLSKLNRCFLTRLSVFKENAEELISKETSLKQKEFILSLIEPSESALLFAFVLLARCMMSHAFVIPLKIPFALAAMYLVSMVFASMTVRFEAQDIAYGVVWAVISPFVLIENIISAYFHKLMSINLIEIIKEKYTKNQNPVYCASVTNGAVEYPCKIEVIVKDSLSRVKITYNKQTIKSAKQFRLLNAMQEVIDKLFERGFALKVCQNCGYFKHNPNGRVNNDQGNCLIKVVKRMSDIPQNTHIWNVCNNMIPIHAKEFVNQQLKNIYG